VIPAIGSGTTQVGAYVLPYYLMPQAADTFRSRIGAVEDAEEIEKAARLFWRLACASHASMLTGWFIGI
jgi:hypothetical protein